MANTRTIAFVLLISCAAVAADIECGTDETCLRNDEESLMQMGEMPAPHKLDTAVSEMDSIKDKLLEIWSGFSEVEAKAAPSWKGDMAAKITTLGTAMTKTLASVIALKGDVDKTTTTITTTRYSLAYHLKALASPTPAPALVQTEGESVTPGTDLDKAVSELHSIKDKLLEVWSGFSEVEAKSPPAWKKAGVDAKVTTLATDMTATLTAVTALKAYVDRTTTTTTTTRYSLAYHLKALAAPTPAP